MHDAIRHRGLIADISRRLALLPVDAVRVLDRALQAIERDRPGADDELTFALRNVRIEIAAEDRERAELHEGARTEMFAGVDRSATPESLQHVAEPMPVIEVIRAGIDRIRRRDEAMRERSLGALHDDEAPSELGAEG